MAYPSRPAPRSPKIFLIPVKGKPSPVRPNRHRPRRHALQDLGHGPPRTETSAKMVHHREEGSRAQCAGRACHCAGQENVLAGVSKYRSASLCGVGELGRVFGGIAGF